MTVGEVVDDLTEGPTVGAARCIQMRFAQPGDSTMHLCGHRLYPAYPALEVFIGHRPFVFESSDRVTEVGRRFRHGGTLVRERSYPPPSHAYRATNNTANAAMSG